MKGDSHDQLNLTPREERAILDEISNDRDLISRLSITPQELEALSKCALLGTLTCKQDMLFILRQIREATSSTIDHTALFPKPPEVKELSEDSALSLRGMVTHPAAVVISVDDLESLEETLDVMGSAALLDDIREALAELSMADAHVLSKDDARRLIADR